MYTLRSDRLQISLLQHTNRRYYYCKIFWSWYEWLANGRCVGWAKCQAEIPTPKSFKRQFISQCSPTARWICQKRAGSRISFFMRIVSITDSLPQSRPYFRTIYLTYYFSVTLKVRVALLLFVLTVRILFSKYKRKRQLKNTAPTSITRATQVKRACKLLCKLIQDGRQSICPMLFYMHGISTIH